ncbi:MAG: hypothetical protein A2075_20735 [Geobacteraceae bacterium GWC2_58_44]|nr:MAG: hypothetical protein A2075_20735 [Geobacteraceae bacterium GWC2_58_44]HBG05294.1 hypothetical protein [Geobacter sp.]
MQMQLRSEQLHTIIFIIGLTAQYFNASRNFIDIRCRVTLRQPELLHPTTLGSPRDVDLCSNPLLKKTGLLGSSFEAKQARIYEVIVKRGEAGF